MMSMALLICLLLPTAALADTQKYDRSFYCIAG
jgi:hypothetical protein